MAFKSCFRAVERATLGKLLFGLHTIAVIDADWITLIIAGLLIGFGANYGSGCTSGHGVCGLSRLSPRSLVATVSFMSAGFYSVCHSSCARPINYEKTFQFS